MIYTGERAVPWNRHTGIQVLQPHVARYAWALQWVDGRFAVDLGCGTGYGSFMLSWAARQVVGIEREMEAVMFARQHFTAANLEFRQGDITNALPQAEVYTAFEVLEHIESPELVTRQIQNGLLVWSMPVNDGSRFHVRPYSVDQIESMMDGEFWYQSADGVIVPKEQAWFEPTYVLGLWA